MIDKDDIKSQVKQVMIDDIKFVLDGTIKSAQLLFVRPNDVIKYIESIGGEYDGEMDTNGRCWDYWLTVSLNDKNYQLSGDGYYENSPTFSLVEEDED